MAFDPKKWPTLKEESKAQLLKLAGMPRDISELDPADIEVGFQHLDFYENGGVVLLVDVQRFFLIADNIVLELNGNSSAIQAANKLAVLKLSVENVLDYVRFVHLFVRNMPDIVDSADDLLGGDLILKRAVKPLKLIKVTPEDGFVCRASMVHDMDLIQLEVEVDHMGLFDVRKEELLGSLVPRTLH